MGRQSPPRPVAVACDAGLWAMAGHRRGQLPAPEGGQALMGGSRDPGRKDLPRRTSDPSQRKWFCVAFIAVASALVSSVTDMDAAGQRPGDPAFNAALSSHADHRQFVPYFRFQTNHEAKVIC